MAYRDELIFADLQLELGEKLRGFTALKPKDQRQLAILIWNAGMKRKRHRDLEDCATFPYQELDKRFGRGRFKAMNQALGVFTVAQEFSVQRQTTRAYALTAKVDRIVSSWLKQDLRRMEDLVDSGGYAVHTIPAAIAAKRAGSITARAWRSAVVKNLVPVNLKALRDFHDHLARLVEVKKKAIRPDLLGAEVEAEKLADWLLDTRKLLKLAHTKAGGVGFIPHRYVLATTGRLFATSLSLQNAPRQVRNAALTGYWDIDIENCHYAILTQMAARFGHRCQQLEHYLVNKSAIRTQIAQRVGITAQQAKDCLLMALYGAKFTEWGEAAIPRYIGASRTARLYSDPAFQAITGDIRGAGKIICKSWPDRSRKELKNAMGLWIREDKDEAKILAHLLQGVEALAIKTITEAIGDDVLLLMHDGLVCRRQLQDGNLRELEEAIYTATGYHLSLEQKQIQVDPDLTHTHRNKDNSKTTTTRNLINNPN